MNQDLIGEMFADEVPDWQIELLFGVIVLPLVSRKQEIVHLVAQYDAQESPEFFRKASELAETYSHIRRIRGDGNCFYSAMLTAQLERCLSDRGELERFTTLCRGWRGCLLGLGFPAYPTERYCDAMDNLLDSMNNGGIQPEGLFTNLNTDHIANDYVAFFRLISSGFLRENESTYTGFVLDGKSMDRYCKDEIEPMWRECEHLSVIALVNAIRVPIRIEYMDQSLSPGGGWHHNSLLDNPGPHESQIPRLYLLYRPGHYDILYRKAEGSSMN